MTANSEQVRRWFFKFYDDLRAKICEEFPTLDFETALFRLASALPACKAQTERQFRAWCASQLKKIDGEKRLYEYADNLTLDDVLTLAASRPVRKNTKPMMYETHGDKIFIKLQDSRGNVLPWRIPSDWLPVARALWPVHVRQSRNGPYVSKKVARQRLNGSWEQRDLPLHHLFLNCEPGDLVDSKDGNYLNWTNGNLCVRKALNADAGNVSLTAYPDTFTLDWKPARSKRIPRSRNWVTPMPYVNEHERKVWAWLSGRTE